MKKVFISFLCAAAIATAAVPAAADEIKMYLSLQIPLSLQ